MINKAKEVEIEYEVSQSITATIKYLEEREPGEYYFSLKRHWVESLFDDEDDEAIAYVEEGKVGEIEGYESGYVRDEERDVIEKIMIDVLANLKSNNHE
jgi:hypothetical protein